MKCLNDDSQTVRRQKIDMNTNSVAYSYNHCNKCGKDYDNEKFEIIHKGNTYIRKKDSNEVDQKAWDK